MTGPRAGGRRQLASGALTVAAGLTVAGLGTIVLMALAARSLPAQQYAAFAVWWTLATLLGTSFGVFEAYLARLVVTEVAASRSARRITAIMTGRALLVVAGLLAALLALAGWLADRLLAGYLGPALLLPVFVLLSAAQALQRGAATGHSRFTAIAGQLSTDGAVRALLAAALIATGAASIETLPVACCVSAAASLAVGHRLCPEWLAQPLLRGRDVAWRPLGYLLVGSAGPLLANNGSVPWLAGTHSASAYTVGAFAGAVTLSRLPTQFISAAFSPLLAQLSHCVEEGDEVTFTKLRRSADLAATALGALFVAMFAALGPWVLSAYLGPRYHLGVLNLAVLAAASGVMFVAVVQQASLAALDRWATIALSWGVGTAAFVVVLLLPLDELLRATTAPLAAVATALAVMSFGRPRLVPRPSTAGSPGDGPELLDNAG